MTDPAAVSQPRPADQTLPGVRLPVARFRLDNGLTVVVQSDRSSPVVAVSVTYRVGSSDEKPGRSGFAHLFEHLMFQGTRSLKPQEYPRLIESNGGEDNAFTVRSRTTYYETVPRNALELALWAESERMHTLQVDARALANEKNVVLEEMRKNYLNTPYAKAMQADLAEAVFSRWENRHTTIGEAADVQGAALDDVRSFYKAHYAPNNAVLTMAGDVAPEEGLALARKYFAQIPASPVPAPGDLSEPPLQGEVRRVVEDSLARNERVVVAWRSPQRGGKDYWALELLRRVIDSDESSPLYQKLVKQDALAVATGARFPWFQSHVDMRGPDVFGVVALPRPQAGLDALLASLDSVVASLSREGPAEADLARAKAQLRLSWLRELEQLTDRANFLGSYAAFVGDPAGLFEDLDAATRLSAEDLRQAAERWLRGAGRAVLHIVPGTPQAPSPRSEIPVPAQEPRQPGQAPPPVLPAPVAALSPVRRFALDNGLSVALIEDGRLPLIEARLSLPGGDVGEEPQERALATAAAGLLLAGTARQDAASVARSLEGLGYSLGVESRLERIVLEGAGLIENAPAFFAQLAEILTEASYPAGEVELWRDQTKQGLKDIRQKPGYMIQEKVHAELFAGHPYENRGLSDEEVDAVTSQRLNAFHAAAFRPSGATLVLAGPLGVDETKAMLERALGGWRGELPRKPLPPLPAARPGRVDFLDRPGSQQVNLTIAQWVPLTVHDDDFLIFQIATHILGGSATARLFTKLREEKGYTYGSYAGAGARELGALWSATAETRPEVAQLALDAMRAEIARLREQPIDPAELANAKRFLAGQFLMQLASMDRVAGFVDRRLFEGRDPARVAAQFVKRLDALTPEQVRQAARAYLAPDRMLVVAVGDAKTLAPLR